MKQQKLFTLIELLVVIAIIAILAAMLLPALSKVKMQGKTAKCQSNIKQVAVAFTNYFATFNDHFPPPHYGTADQLASTIWCDLMADQLVFRRYTNRTLIPGHVLTCPATTSPGVRNVDRWDNGGIGYGSIHYGFNQSLSNNVPTFRQVGEIKKGTSQHLLLAGSMPVCTASTINPEWAQRGVYRLDFPQQVAFRHNKRSPAVFLDMHMEMGTHDFLRMGATNNLPFNRAKLSNRWLYQSDRTALISFAPF